MSPFDPWAAPRPITVKPPRIWSRCPGLPIQASNADCTLVWPVATFSPHARQSKPARSSRSPASDPSLPVCVMRFIAAMSAEWACAAVATRASHATGASPAPALAVLTMPRTNVRSPVFGPARGGSTRTAFRDAVAAEPMPESASAVMIPVVSVAATRSPPTNCFVNSTGVHRSRPDIVSKVMAEPAAPRAVADALYARDACSQALSIEIVSVSAGSCTARMAVRTEMCNGFGIVHGGMTFLLADTAMAFASNADNEVALASSAEIDWLAPAQEGDVLTATAERRWSNGRSTVWDIAITNGSGDTVAIARGRTRKVGRPVVE